MWIPVGKRLPPNTKEEILVYEEISQGDHILGYYETRKSGIILQHIKEDINYRNKIPAVKYWMKIYDPKKE